MSDTMERLSTLAHDQLAAEAKVEQAELALKQAKEALRAISEDVIPSVMEELGLEDFTTNDGLKIAVPEQIRASITKANEGAAFLWLRDNGHGALIKDMFEVLAANEDEANRIRETVAAFSNSREKPTVHPQTLGKFVREAMEEGIILPDSISVFRQRIAKVVVKS